MAYVSKQDKAELAPTIKAVLKKYGMKGTISVQHHSSLVVKIKSGVIDFSDSFKGADSYIQVNEYWLDQRYSGVGLAFLKELLDAMKGPKYFNEDDVMTDYFHRSHYTDIAIGQYDAPYVCTNKKLEEVS